MELANDVVPGPHDSFGVGWGRIGHRLAGAGGALFVSFFLLLVLTQSAGLEVVLVLAGALYGVGVPISLLLDWTIRRRLASYPVVVAHGVAGLLVATLTLALMTSPSVVQDPAGVAVMVMGAFTAAMAAVLGLLLRGSLAVAAAVAGPAFAVMVAVV